MKSEKPVSTFDISSLKGKRLLICEEALTDYKGHFYTWIKAIRTIHQQAGVEVLVAGNKQMDEAIRKEFNAFPVYSRNNWSGIYNYKQPWKRYLAVFAHNFRIWRETRALLRKTGPVDCILMPQVRIHNLIAWQRLCRKGMGKDFKRVILFLLIGEAIYDESFTTFRFKRTSGLIKSVLGSFKDKVAAGQVILAGDSHITCHEYATLSNVPFRVFPSPAAGLQILQSNSSDPLFSNRSVPATFVILGVSFFDKGIDLLQDAILNLLQKKPQLSARFIIQWAVPMYDYSGAPVAISEELRKAKQVQLIEHVLDENAYHQYLQQADFVVLPYRRKIYFNRISGVAIEAACLGIPMIVTENTWLDWAMNEYGTGVTVKNEDAIDLAEKIELCLEKKEELKRKAMDRKSVALELNSTNRYLKCVWE